MVEPFRFDRAWQFGVPASELWEKLSRREEFPQWWGWLRECEGAGLVEGGVTTCCIRAPLPYELRFVVTVDHLVPERLLEATVSGDLHGDARLGLRELAPGCEAHLTWEVEIRRPLLHSMARVARPLLEWGHEWVVATGVAQFRDRAIGPAAHVSEG